MLKKKLFFIKTLNFIYFTTITHDYKLATRWSCWVENIYETFLVRESHWNFFPGWKTLSYSCWLLDSNPRPPSNSVVVLTPRLAHRPNHSATKFKVCTREWFSMCYHSDCKLAHINIVLRSEYIVHVKWFLAYKSIFDSQFDM